MFRSLVKGFVLSLGASAPILWSDGAMGAGLLDFEVTPAGVAPADNQELTAPYAIPGGSVRFFFDVNGNRTYEAGVDLNPVFEGIGRGGIDGFRSTFNGSFDLARSGYETQLGSYFLRYPADFQVKDVGSQPFIIDYDAAVPILELSGEIWDIDSAAGGMEQWRLEVLDAVGGVLASQLSPLGISQNSPDSLDSLPWTFQFRELPSGVDKLRITFVGTKTTGLGFALNNFSPTEAVPEPSAMLLASFGAMLLCARRWMSSLARGGPGGRS